MDSEKRFDVLKSKTGRKKKPVVPLAEDQDSSKKRKHPKQGIIGYFLPAPTRYIDIFSNRQSDSQD